jgi:hypothetical protein
VPLVRGSTTGDPLLSSSVVGVLTSPATNGVMSSCGPANRPRSTCILGMSGVLNGGSGGPGSDCPGDLGGDGFIGRYYGGMSPPLVRSCGGDGAADVQEPVWWNPAWRSSTWRNPSIFGEISPDQVKN